MVQTPAVM
jgi:hypothetical protein